MIQRYFDAHCHIQFENYAHDQEDVIARMRDEGVAGIVVGVDRASSEKAIALAAEHEYLYAAVGLHPNSVGREPFDVAVFEALAAHPQVVAIGECGLDYYRPVELNDEVKAAQRAALAAHIDLAAKINKPLIIHSRPTKGTQDAYQDLIGLLEEKQAEHGPVVRGDIHFFVGGVAEAARLFALNFTVSFTAVITFTHDYDEVIRAAPLERILSETDAPYVAPAARRRERNDPLAVAEVVAQSATVRCEEPEEVRKALLANAKRLFGV
jgi:TatD DNase family protein